MLEDVVPAMHRLLAALRAGELVDDELLDEVAGFVHSKLGDGPTRKLRNLVEGFAQDEAAELLLEIAGEFKVDLNLVSYTASGH